VPGARHGRLDLRLGRGRHASLASLRGRGHPLCDGEVDSGGQDDACRQGQDLAGVDIKGSQRDGGRVGYGVLAPGRHPAAVHHHVALGCRRCDADPAARRHVGCTFLNEHGREGRQRRQGDLGLTDEDLEDVGEATAVVEGLPQEVHGRLGRRAGHQEAGFSPH
jgi:hypothetical protein